MFYDPGDQLAILHSCSQHLGYSPLYKYTLLRTFLGYANVDSTALGSKNLHTQTLLGEINLARVAVINLNSRRNSRNLDRK